MYWKRAASVDGLQYRCKECERPGYEQREAERKRAAKAAYVRQWRKRNPEHVRQYNAEKQDYRNAYNRRAKFRHRVAAHLLETEAVYTLWHTLNGDGPRAREIDARALVAEWERAGVPNECQHGCGNEWREIVHVVPLYENGEHNVTNLAPQCRRCP
ncbi:hypothetical protein [Streptomyces sp. NPDC048142]|uniref:hypothetical protein n=1 Tax=Streptomyces sp. NPDC048142 TaxID=3365501 RepID=UPI003716B521